MTDRWGHSFWHHVRVYLRYWWGTKRTMWFFLKQGKLRALRWPWSKTAPWRQIYRMWTGHMEDR